MKKGVFISYSHADKDYIAPIVKMIRGMMGNLVFQDYDNLELGKLWEPQLLESLANAKKVLVFWSSQSAESVWVKKEYRLAIKEAKDIMPILLDDTPMPHDLSAYQGVNMSALISYGNKKTKSNKKITYRGGDSNTDENSDPSDAMEEAKNTEADQRKIALKLFDELSKTM